MGAVVALAASLPLIASLAVLVAYFRKKHLGSIPTKLVWTVAAIAGVLGGLQALTDPGDAFWAGLPLLAAAALLALSLMSLPKAN